MSYVTSTELLAREEGRVQELHESIALVLESKFGDAGATLAREIQAISDVNKLRELQRHAVRSSKTIEELRALLV